MQQNPMIYQLYAVTAPAADLAEQVKRAIAGGITMLQIRERTALPSGELNWHIPFCSCAVMRESPALSTMTQKRQKSLVQTVCTWDSGT